MTRKIEMRLVGKTVAVIAWDGRTVSVTGDDDVVNGLQAVDSFGGGTTFSPADGERYLAAVLAWYAGDTFKAVEV